MLTTLDNRSFMREAIGCAARVPCRPWPNPPVGALVVLDDGRVVGRGAHHGPGTRHAEIVALDEAGELGRGATLFCTLEPCNHQGRTPPCAPRIAASGIRRLVVGVLDPNPAVSGGGLGVVRRAGIDVTLGVAAEEALELIWPFVASKAFGRPYVQLKTATSVDARFAPPARDSSDAPGIVYITGLEARRDVHRLRRWSDLVLVGSGTILADRPLLDGRLAVDIDCPAGDPIPGYVDTDLSVEASWPGRPHLVFAGRESSSEERCAAVRQSGGRVVLCDETGAGVSPASIVAQLLQEGVRTVLLEGGPRLAHSFLAAGLVDRWVSFVAPKVFGGGPTWPSATGPSAAIAAAGASRAVGDDELPFAAADRKLPEAATASRADGDGGGAASAFTLTRCERAGADARLVLDRVAFEPTLRRLSAAREV